MDPGRRRLIWLLVRLTAYIVVLTLLFQARKSVDWRHLFSRARTEGAPANTLVLAGGDLAPDLVARLVEAYRRDFPRVQVELHPGGTRAALEELVNRKCDVALSLRPVTSEEQALFLGATGDSAQAVPFALGGLVLLRAAPGAADTLHMESLRRLAAGRRVDRVARLYVPDPNDGLWGAFLLWLAPGQPDSVRPEGVFFLADAAAVLEAVRNDPEALGLASSLSLPENTAEAGVQTVAVAGDTAGVAARPTYENIGNARYPLFHYLYAVSRPGGGLEGKMFITHLTSSRGQRQVERSGTLPARQALRPIILSTDPIGGTP